MKNLAVTLLVAASAAAASPAAAQKADFHWEKAVAAGTEVALHNVSGDVTVRRSTSGKVEVVGVTKGRNDDARVHVEVKETSRGIVVCVVNDDDDWSCDERGMRSYGRDNRGRRDSWDRNGINLEVAIPVNTPLTASSVSGNVTVNGAQGDVRASSVSGDVRLEHTQDVASLDASTVSGSVNVQIETLTGRGDLRFKSVSGDVVLELPKVLNADVSMTTVSGSMDSDYPLTLNGRMARRRIEARIGTGGRNIDIGTVSGDVRLHAAR